MIPAITVTMAIAGVLFGVYQWRRQRGRILVRVDEGQAELYVRVVVDAPTPVHVNAMWFQVKGRWRVLRLLRWLRDSELSVRRRFEAMWRFRDMDLMMARMEWAAEWSGGLSDPSPEKEALYPIAGPKLPATIPAYHDSTWLLPGVNFVPAFCDLQDHWRSRKPKLQFRVAVSGHPHRIVRSRWIRMSELSILKPENAHWMEGDIGLPQPRFARETQEKFESSIDEELN